MSEDPKTKQTFRIEIRFDFYGTKAEAEAKAVAVAAQTEGEVTAIFDETFEEV